LSTTKKIKVGNVVYDSGYGMTGLVVELNPSWYDESSGENHTWQFGVLYEDGHVGYADSVELELKEVEYNAKS